MVGPVQAEGLNVKAKGKKRIKHTNAMRAKHEADAATKPRE